MRLARIHVNQHKLRANRSLEEGEEMEPVVTVKRGGRSIYGYEVDCPDGCQVVYRPEKPLSCGAVLWVETRGRVLVDGEEVL